MAIRRLDWPRFRGSGHLTVSVIVLVVAAVTACTSPASLRSPPHTSASSSYQIPVQVISVRGPTGLTSIEANTSLLALKSLVDQSASPRGQCLRSQCWPGVNASGTRTLFVAATLTAPGCIAVTAVAGHEIGSSLSLSVVSTNDSRGCIPNAKPRPPAVLLSIALAALRSRVLVVSATQTTDTPTHVELSSE